MPCNCGRGKDHTQNGDEHPRLRDALVEAKLASHVFQSVDIADGEMYTSIGVRTNEEAAAIAIDVFLDYLQRTITVIDFGMLLAKSESGVYDDPSYG